MSLLLPRAPWAWSAIQTPVSRTREKSLQLPRKTTTMRKDLESDDYEERLKNKDWSSPKRRVKGYLNKGLQSTKGL